MVDGIVKSTENKLLIIVIIIIIIIIVIIIINNNNNNNNKLNIMKKSKYLNCFIVCMLVPHAFWFRYW